MLSVCFPTFSPPAAATSSKNNSHLPYFGSKLLSLNLGNKINLTSRSGKLLVALASSSNVAADDQNMQNGAEWPEGLQAELMPKHVAILPDGHRRWAEEKNLPVEFGYGAGHPPLKDIAALCCHLGIKVLSVYAFSTGNWQRAKEKVDFAMNIIEATMKSDLVELNEHGIRVSIFGNRSALPKRLQELVTLVEETTKDNTKLQLLAAVNYNGRSDIIQACTTLADKVKNGLIQLEDIDESQIQQELQTNCSKYPNPDLFIRTGGTYRLGNFLLWQMAYSELYFVEKYAPDFEKADFIEALRSYQKMHRRFGGYTHSKKTKPIFD